MKKFIAAAVAVSAATLVASPASAAQFFVGAGPVQPDSNVLFQTNSTVGNPVTGSLNNSPALISFSSNETLSVTSSNGQARISGSDGNLTNLVIALSSGFNFSAIEFNLNALANGFATLTFAGPDGTSSVQPIMAAGQNFFAATGNFNTVTISTTSQLSDVRQIRVTAVAAPAVPEPATWAMMLVGFAGVGVAMRRRRSGNALVRQVA